MAFGYSLAHLGSLRRLYQGLFFCLFLVFPMAAQVHFFDKMTGGEVKDWTNKYQELNVWTPVPWKELDDENWHRFMYGEDTLTFYPFVMPLGMLIIEIVIGAFFLHTATVLFTGERRSGRGRRGALFRRFTRRILHPQPREVRRK